MGNRHAFERARLAPYDAGVGGPCLRQRDLGAHIEKGIQWTCGDVIKQATRQFFGANRARAQAGCEGAQTGWETRRVLAHSITLGTR